MLNDTFEKLVTGVSELKRESAKENRIADYILLLENYSDKFDACAEYDGVLEKAKGLIGQDRLNATIKTTLEKEAKKATVTEQKKLELEPIVQLFKDRLLEVAGKYTPYINFYGDSTISIQYFNEATGGPLTVGIVKLDGRKKYIKINNPDMGDNYNDEFIVEGKIDDLLPHVGKFIEKIKNYEKAISKINKQFDHEGVALLGKDAWEKLSKR
jgi:hypothetical protein